MHRNCSSRRKIKMEAILYLYINTQKRKNKTKSLLYKLIQKKKNQNREIKIKVSVYCFGKGLCSLLLLREKS